MSSLFPRAVSVYRWHRCLLSGVPAGRCCAGAAAEHGRQDGWRVLQKHQGAEGDSGERTHADDAVHSVVAGCGMRFLPRGARVRQRRQEAERDSAEDDPDAVRHQQEQLRRRTRSYVQQLPPWGDASGSCAGRSAWRAPSLRAQSTKPNTKRKWISPSGRQVRQCWPSIIEAVGGKPALDKISARVEKGSAMMPAGTMWQSIFTASRRMFGFL